MEVWMVWENLHGMMARFMKGNSMMGSLMVKESWNFQMECKYKEFGKMELIKIWFLYLDNILY